MREIMKRTVAAVMAVLIACAAAGCSSTGNSSSGSSSAGETTTTTAPVVEDMGNIDLSDVTTEYDVPEDFSYESEAEEGTLSGGAAVLDKNFLGKFSGDGFVSIGSSGDMAEFEIDFPAKGSYILLSQWQQTARVSRILSLSTVRHSRTSHQPQQNLATLWLKTYLSTRVLIR